MSTYNNWRAGIRNNYKVKLIPISTSDIYIGTRTAFTPIPRPTRNLPQSISSKEWAFALSEIGKDMIMISFNKSTTIFTKVFAVYEQYKH
jgi:hypothetical protein